MAGATVHRVALLNLSIYESTICEIHAIIPHGTSQNIIWNGTKSKYNHFVNMDDISFYEIMFLS